MAHPLIEAWFKNAEGKGLDPDRSYGWQCVDAADHYAEAIFPGVSWRVSLGPVPGARSLMDTANTKYFTKIWNDGSVGLIPQRGDILVYEGWAANKWGHTGVVSSANTSRVTLLQQDGFAAPYQFVNGNWYSKKPAHYATYGYALGPNGTGLVRGWLRPKLAEDKAPATVKPAATKPKPKPKPKPKAEKIVWRMDAGDNLAKIVRYYNGPTAKQIIKANPFMNRATVPLGTVVTIPGKLEWVVERGDTWEKVARYYAVSVAHVKNKNPKIKTLQPGQVLRIQ